MQKGIYFEKNYGEITIRMTDDSIMGLRPLPDKQETVLLLKKLVKDLKIKQGELSKRAGIPPIGGLKGPRQVKETKTNQVRRIAGLHRGSTRQVLVSAEGKKSAKSRRHG